MCKGHRMYHVAVGMTTVEGVSVVKDVDVPIHVEGAAAVIAMEKARRKVRKQYPDAQRIWNAVVVVRGMVIGIDGVFALDPALKALFKRLRREFPNERWER